MPETPIPCEYCAHMRKPRKDRAALPCYGMCYAGSRGRLIPNIKDEPPKWCPLRKE